MQAAFFHHAAGGSVRLHMARGEARDAESLLRESDHRLRRLMEFGLQGLEAFYSGFSAKLEEENLHFADRFRLYVTAGSDYHGSNKLVRLGDTNLDKARAVPDGMIRFFEIIGYRPAQAGVSCSGS